MRVELGRPTKRATNLPLSILHSIILNRLTPAKYRYPVGKRICALGPINEFPSVRKTKIFPPQADQARPSVFISDLPFLLRGKTAEFREAH